MSDFMTAGAVALNLNQKDRFAMTKQTTNKNRPLALAAPAALAAGLFAASASYAAAPKAYGVYDAHNTFVGTLEGQPAQGQSWVIHQFGAKIYQMQFDTDGLTTNALFVFSTTNCSGTKYDYYSWEDSHSVPQIAQFDGTDVWTVLLNSEVTISVQSLYNSGYIYSNGSHCIPWPYDSFQTAVAVKVDTTPPNWVKPFEAR